MTINERKTFVCELTRDEFDAIPAFAGRDYETFRPFVMIVINENSIDHWLGFNRYGVMEYAVGTLEQKPAAEILDDVQRLIDADYFPWESLLETYDKTE